MENQQLYKITVDGIDFESTSPLNEEIIRRKLHHVRSDAFNHPATTEDEAEKLLVKL